MLPHDGMIASITYPSNYCIDPITLKEMKENITGLCYMLIILWVSLDIHCINITIIFPTENPIPNQSAEEDCFTFNFTVRPSSFSGHLISTL